MAPIVRLRNPLIVVLVTTLDAFAYPYHHSHINTALRAFELEGCVCLVTGASRGIGKGIAIELGRAGATVYVTGTSTETPLKSNIESAFLSTSETGGPGTIEETARAIDAAGGVGFALYCNHANDDDVIAVMETINERHGKIDILVNNAFRLPAGGTKVLYGKFWELPMNVWDTLHNVGLRSHYVATCKAMPLLLKSTPRAELPRPLIAMISSFGGLTYTFNVPYGVGKAAVDRLAKDMAVELEDQNICVTSFWPGVVNTERTQIAVASGDWEKNVGIPLEQAESAAFTGKAVVAVATDSSNMVKSGTYQVVAELASEYGFTDVEGRHPPSIRSLRFLLPSYGPNEMKRIPVNLIPDWKLPFWLMGKGKPPKPNATE
jgi:dehydrogenase/reductase SDR family protein 1